MRILLLSNRIPWPLKDGGTVAIHQLMRGLSEHGCTVDVLAMNTSRQWIDPKSIPAEAYAGTHWELIDVDNRIRPLPAFLNLFSLKSYNVVRFISRDFEAALQRKLQENQYDIIHLEGTYTLPYLPVIREFSKSPVVLRTHNVEYRIWETLSRHSTSIFKKWYLGLLARRLRRFETKELPKTDALVPITEADAAQMAAMGCKQPIHVCPTGIDTDKIQPQPQNGAPVLFHLGAMDWRPNQEGLLWFLNQVWPLVIRENKNARLVLAGKGMPLSWKEMKVEGVEIAGEVPDAAAFMEGKDILVIPLLSGSGLRIKMLEGMAYGKAIVTTPAGVAGIPAEAGKHFFLGANPADFARAVLYLLANKSLRMQLGAEARRLVEEKYSHSKVIADLLQFYRSLL